MQEHDIWRHVEHDVVVARERAPEGYEAVVRVFLAGREPITLGFVRTRRIGGEVWLRFEAEGPPPPEDDGELTIPEQVYWIHAPAASVLCAEVSYRRVGAKPLGFGVEAIDD